MQTVKWKGEWGWVVLKDVLSLKWNGRQKISLILFHPQPYSFCFVVASTYPIGFIGRSLSSMPIRSRQWFLHNVRLTGLCFKIINTSHNRDLPHTWTQRMHFSLFLSFTLWKAPPSFPSTLLVACVCMLLLFYQTSDLHVRGVRWFVPVLSIIISI